jgi:hypothetical protein
MGATSTAEFNSLKTCRRALEQVQEHMMIQGICVEK